MSTVYYSPLMLTVPVTLDKSLRIPIYKMSSSQIYGEDSLVNIYYMVIPLKILKFMSLRGHLTLCILLTIWGLQ